MSVPLMGRPKLPVDDFLGNICESLVENGQVVLVAEPGAGKTTRVPPAILAHSGLISPDHHLIILQPRRTAARSTAEWIAREQGWKLGQEVGYQVRFERKIGPETRLQVLTEGILTRRLLADPALTGCGAVILDEFHERNLDAELALMLLRESREALRPDLKIMVMSATIDAKSIASYLDNCPIIEVPGRTFPVKIDYDQSSAQLPFIPRIAKIVENAATVQPDGDILVFLPGQREIREVRMLVQPLVESQILLNTEIRTLHGSMPLADQIRTLEPGNFRRIILSTNIAETSLTIEGVTTVIDSGLVRQAGFEDVTGLDSLRTRRISQASARQRSGRAGRLGPGRAIRVWSPQENIPEFDLPEIQRLDLSSFLLSCLSWGWNEPENLKWLATPPSERLEAARILLDDLQATASPTGGLTQIGRQLAKIPLHPRLGRILIEAVNLGQPRLGAMIAALISERDFIEDHAVRSLAERAGHRSDMLLRLDHLRREFGNRASGIDHEGLHRVRQVASQLERIVSGPELSKPLKNHRHSLSTFSDAEEEEQIIARLILSGFSDRLCRRSQRGSRTAFMARGLGVRLSASSLETENEFFLAIDPRREDATTRGSEPTVRIALGLQKEWLDDWLNEKMTNQKSMEFDQKSGKARWFLERKIHALTISRTEFQPSPKEQADAFEIWAVEHATELFLELPDVRNWLSRYQTLQRLWPELSLPEPDWELAIKGWAQGIRNRSELPNGSALSWVLSTLPPDAPKRVEAELPTSITLPNGRSARIDYDSGQEHPLIQARVQDFFGWHESPCLASGRLPILLELLAPNQRPVQRTLDLKSFWANTYPQVRKDLRGRYPKHHWPEDPWTATAGPSIRKRQEN